MYLLSPTFAWAENIFFQDSFTEGSDTSIASHTPDVGTSWTLLIQSNSGTLKVKAASDSIQGETAGNSTGAFYTADLTTGYPTANYDVSITQGNGDTADDTNMLGARIQDANNMYAYRYNEGAGQLYKRTTGTWETLGTATAGIADGSVIILRVNGNQISVLDDGVVIRTVTDSTHASAGKGGFGMGQIIVANDDIAQQDSDDFKVTAIRRVISLT